MEKDNNTKDLTEKKSIEDLKLLKKILKIEKSVDEANKHHKEKQTIKKQLFIAKLIYLIYKTHSKKRNNTKYIINNPV